MKTVKISNVHYEMLVAASKKAHKKPEALLEALIQTQFNGK